MKKKNAVENGIESTKHKEYLTDSFEKKNDKLDAEFTKPEKPEDQVPPISYFALFRYAILSEKWIMAVGILCSIVTGVCQPLNTLLFGTLTGDMIKQAAAIQEAIKQHNYPALEEAKDVLISYITDFATNNSYIGLGMLIFSYVSIALFNYTALKQTFRIRSLFFKSTLNQDISWYDVNQTGDFASRISEDLIKLEEGIGEKVSMFIHYQVAFLSSLILAFVKGWELALICLISFPVTMLSVGIVSRITSKLAKKELAAYGVAGAIAEEVFSSIRTVIAFGGQKKEIERYFKKLVFARDINIKRSMFSGIGFGLLWFCIYGSYALAFWYGVGLVIKDKKLPPDDRTYDPGTMVTVFFSVMMGSMNFGISSPYFETFAIATGAGAKIYNVINNLPIINSDKGRGEKPSAVKGHITFKDVHFQYPSRADVPILTGFNLQINAGETVALVGSSGCGKSTCIQLLQRFYDPISGSILLDDRDLKDLDLDWLRDKIGVVGQEPVLFGTTIEENIRYGKLDATMEEIEAAAKKSNAHDFIQNLPQGYNTLVGERGAQLSGGQKQRIAIARALVRNPAILLLDEATSALDTNSEAKVQAALDNASHECTTIIVAHRLSTIRNADKIVVVSEGKVVEEGKHDELMEKKGAYFNLVTTQVNVDETIDKSKDIEKRTKSSKIRSSAEDVTLLKRTISITSETSINEESASNVQLTTVASEVDEKEKEPNVSFLDVIKLNSPEWKVITVGCIGSLVMGAAMPIFAVIFGDIVKILSGDNNDTIRSETNLYCVYFVIAGVATGFATFFQIWTFGIAGEKLTMRLRGKMFEAILSQEVAWFDDRDNGVGSLCSRLSTDAANVQGATGTRIGMIIQSFSTLGLGVGLSMYYEWRLGLVAMSFTPLILIATFLQGRIIKQATTEQTKMTEKATKLAVEAITNIRTVASLGREDKFHEYYIEELRPGLKKSKRNLHFRGIVFGLGRSLMFFAYAACMYYGGVLIKKENISFEKVFKVSQALIMGTVSIANALAFAPNLQKGLESAAKIFRLFKRVPAVRDAPTASRDSWKDANISYTDVTFHYPTRPGVKVLRELNLLIQQGKTVALVGPSGCGKSTLIQLLERFYDPNSGYITIDEKDIREIKLEALRSQMGIVSQEPSLFDRTIEENIAYGDNSREVTKNEVIEAAKKANIHNFIVSLPTGYDTGLGEKGTQLSGGQKQRIAIARALVRDPKILLLDEATSALDTESEKVVQDALDKAKQGRTCITIAHRLSTIQDADVICVINRGKIAEMGTHTQLLTQRGLYYHLHSLQS